MYLLSIKYIDAVKFLVSSDRGPGRGRFTKLRRGEDISGRVIKIFTKLRRGEDIPGRVIKIQNVEQFPVLSLSRDGRYFSTISFVQTNQRSRVSTTGEN